MREEWIDSWRGILIGFIVLFHVLGMGAYYAPDSVQDILVQSKRAIEFFHVIAFFSLTAVVWRRKDTSIGRFMSDKFKRLMIPYFVFGAISILVFAVLSGLLLKNSEGTAAHGAYSSYAVQTWWKPIVSLVHAGGWPDGVGLKANQVLWFLPCMYVTIFVYFIFDRFVRSMRWQLVSCFVWAACFTMVRLFNIDALPFSMQLVPRYMVFLILARWLIPCTKMKLVANRPMAVLVVAVAAFALVYVDWPIWHLTDRMPGWGRWMLYPVLVAVAYGRHFVAVFCSALLAQVITCRKLAVIGSMSLGIMLMHKFVILAFQAKSQIAMALFSNCLTVALAVCLITALGIVIPMVAVLLLRKVAPWSLGECKR